MTKNDPTIRPAREQLQLHDAIKAFVRAHNRLAEARRRAEEAASEERVAAADYGSAERALAKLLAGREQPTVINTAQGFLSVHVTGRGLRVENTEVIHV